METKTPHTSTEAVMTTSNGVECKRVSSSTKISKSGNEKPLGSNRKQKALDHDFGTPCLRSTSGRKARYFERTVKKEDNTDKTVDKKRIKVQKSSEDDVNKDTATQDKMNAKLNPSMKNCVVLLPQVKYFHCQTRGDNKEILKTKVTQGKKFWRHVKDAQTAVSENTVAIKIVVKENAITVDWSPTGIQPYWESQLSQNSITIDDGKSLLPAICRNAESTLAFNPKLASIIVNDVPETSRVHFEITKRYGVFPGIRFAMLSEDEKDASGIMYTDSKLSIGVPVFKCDGLFFIQKIFNGYQLFNGLPLIGTDSFNLPVFVNSCDLKECRGLDDIVTINFNCDSRYGSANRQVFLDFVVKFQEFVNVLSHNYVQHLHQFLRLGMPDYFLEKQETLWYYLNVISPIRTSLYKLPLVKTVSGDQIKIQDTLFPAYLVENKKDFYELAAKVIPFCCPNKDTIEDWWEIIQSDEQHHYKLFKVKNLTHMFKSTTLKDLPSNMDIDFIKQFLKYLQETNQLDVLSTHAILPNQNGILKESDQIFYDFGVSNELKCIAAGFGFDINEDLLHKDVDGSKIVPKYDIEKKLLNGIDTIVKKLDVTKANKAQSDAILALSKMFVTTDEERQQWWNSLTEIIYSNDFNCVLEYDEHSKLYHSWAEKYIAYTIQKCCTVDLFVKRFFTDKETNAFWKWIDGFVKYILTYNPSLASDYAIIPTQSGYFKKLSSEIYRQTSSIEEVYKDWYRDYVPGAGDPRFNIVDDRISADGINIDSGYNLVRKVDDLFAGTSCLELVKPNGSLHSLFQELNAWFDENEEKGIDMFPNFSLQRPILLMCSLSSVERSEAGKILRNRKNLSILPAISDRAAHTTVNFNCIATINNFIGHFNLPSVKDKCKQLTKTP